MSWKMKKMYCPLIYKTIIISILIFFNSSSYAFYKKLFDPIIPDKIYIDLNKKNLGIMQIIFMKFKKIKI